MESKNIFRFLVSVILVPLAIFLGLWFGLYKNIIVPTKFLVGDTGHRTTKETANLLGKKWVTIEKKLKKIGCGLSGTQKTSALYKNYLKHKNDELGKVFYANYAISLEPPDAKQKIKYKTPDYSSTTESTISDLQYLKAIKTGEKIDPENMFYNLLLADYYLDRGVVGKGEFKSITSSTIIDKGNYQRGLQEIDKLINKPFTKYYSREYGEYILSLMPTPTTFIDSCMVMGLSDNNDHGGAYTRTFARKISYVIQIMLKNEHQAEAIKMLDNWATISKKFISDSNTFVNFRSSQASSEILAKTAMGVYKQAGLINKAEKLSKQIDQMQSWKITDEQKDIPKEITKQSSVITHMVHTYLGKIKLDKKELAPARYIEYLQLYKLVVIIVVLLLMLQMICNLPKGFFWRIKSNNEDKPLTHLLGWKDYARAIGYGTILPIALYLIASLTPFIGKFEYAISNNLPVTLILAALFLLISSFIPTWIIGNAIRKKWRNSPNSSETLSFAIVSVSAISIIILSICLTILLAQEKKWILRDNYMVMRIGLNNGGVMGIERLSVDMQKARMLKLLDE